MILVNSTYYASIFIFMSGLVLKFFRTPFHTIVILTGKTGFHIAGIAYLDLKKRANGQISLVAFGLGADM